MRSFFGRLHRTVNRYPLPFCALFALLVTFVVEACNARAVFGGLVLLFTHPIYFFLNYVLLFTLFVPCIFLRRRYAYLIAASLLPALICTVQLILLHYRGFPFMAGDLLSFFSGPDIVFSYLTVPQFILACAALVAALVLLVLLLRRLIRSERPHGVQRLISLILAPVLLLGSVLTVALSGRLTQSPAESYRSHGLTYSFAQSLFHSGMKRPDGYSAAAVAQAQERLIAESMPTDAPNLIYIQLEAFSDFAQWRGLTASEYPTPFFHSLLESCPHGYLQIDKVGFGTADSEFEVLTAMDIWDVGIAALPYNSFLQNRTAESVATVLKRYGYSAFALHNHAYDFYSRHKVYPNLGFDAFYSVESMEGVTYNRQNWARDEVFASLIPSLLSATDTRDFLFGVTVQGHGGYPDGIGGLPITVTGARSQKQNERLSYYFSELHETDRMLATLFAALEEYPEPVTVLLYGDHLPGIEAKAEELVTDSLYHTPYVIWSNQGTQGAAVRRDMEAYEITPWLFDSLGIHAGTMFRCRQSEASTDDDAVLFTYDLLKGEQYCMAEHPLSPTPDFRYGAQLRPKKEESGDAS